METVSLYTEARNEYLKQLSTWISPPLVEFFRKEYNALAVKDGKHVMSLFQSYCAEVPRWNQDIIETHVADILDSCRCDYVEELMTAVFIAHTKMLTAIRVNSKQKKLQITLPKLDHFIHRVFIECARSFWKAPFLFALDLSPVEKQKNILQAEIICSESISGAVRSLLPVKNILRDYLDDENDDEEEEKKEVKETVAETLETKDDEETTVATASIVAPVAEAVVAPVVEAVVAPTASAEAVVAPTTSVAPTASVEAVVAPVVESVVAPTASVAPVVEAVVESVVVPSVAPTASVAPVVEPIVEPVAPKEKKPKTDTDPKRFAQSPVILEKLQTTPTEPKPLDDSPHTVPIATKESVVNIEKSEVAPQVVIDTEPMVHFTPYDTVFDETKSGVSEIQYNPKISVEEKPPSTWGLEDDVPKIKIQSDANEISGLDIEDLDAPDIDMSLGSTADFEVIA